jgi:N-carbamoylputrescine amidase
MKLAVVQMAMSSDLQVNLTRAEDLVREAAARGAGLILLPELFESLYFPQQQREERFQLSHPVSGHPFLGLFAEMARELKVVLPVSFFERAGQAHYNSLQMIDASGEALGCYRKTHIPDGPGYQEKYYFNPGDTGFRTWSTAVGAVGVGICWDQWFPECARAMALQGADLLLYPTAIGSEPPEADSLDTRAMWQRAMLGHAVCNSCYLAAANRVGQEGEARFYGHSFIADFRGEILAEADDHSETILQAEVDLELARSFRAGMGFFRDRRPEHYRTLLTLDGTTRPWKATELL